VFDPSENRRKRRNTYNFGVASVGIVASILSADFACLGEQVRAADTAGADRVQVDVMDGHFVPNITMGPLVVEAVRRCTDLTLEAHLMITNPERYIDTFADAGADVIIVHQEVSPHLHRTIQQIKEAGKRAGVAINPSTPTFMLDDMLPLLDLVLVMTINPGFGGQELIPETLPKIAAVRRALDARGLTCDVEVDGGVHESTASLVVEAGANLLVSGSGIYNDRETVAEAMKRLRAAIAEAQE
jgi:ribulose-phosphate 3-epimerase